MALGSPYATVPELKARIKIANADVADDAVLTAILAGTTLELEGWCGRQFNLDTAPSARRYYVTAWDRVHTADFATITSVATDEDDDGTFETTWAAADYQLEPLDGVVNGLPGFPYSKVRAVGTRTFPISGQGFTSRKRPSVQVTAIYGFPSVPADVHEAALLLGSETFKLQSAPFGVAGFGEYGVVRVRDNPKIASLLERYVLGGGVSFA